MFNRLLFSLVLLAGLAMGSNALAQEPQCIRPDQAALGLFSQYGEVLVAQGVNAQALVLMFQNPATTSFSIIALDLKGCAHMVVGGEAWEVIPSHPPPVKEAPI